MHCLQQERAVLDNSSNQHSHLVGYMTHKRMLNTVSFMIQVTVEALIHDLNTKSSGGPSLTDAATQFQ